MIDIRNISNVASIKSIFKEFLAFTCLIFIFLSSQINSYALTIENLDEVVARKARTATATWGPSNMENATNNYIWQPETLMYFDVGTGHEVWRMTTTKDMNNIFHDDIGWSQWSANGKWLAFGSSRNTNAYTLTDSSRIWMITHTDGSHLMPVIGGSNRRQNSHHPYFHWSPQIADVYYDTGDGGNGLTLKEYDVYKNSVSNTGVTRKLLFTTNTVNGNSKEKMLSKTISGDGQKILLRDAYVASGPHYLYPCTVYPEESAGCTDLDGYSIDRGQGIGYDGMPASYTREHSGGLFLSGNSSMGYYVYLLPSGTTAWWRMNFTGSSPDGGPLYTAPGTSGEVVIQSTKTPTYPPWPEHFYWSHMTPDWWGNRVVFSNTEDDSRPGVAHINAATHTYDARYNLKDYSVQHNDWHGFTDYTVSSWNPASGGGFRIIAQKYNDATLTDIQTVCFTHTRENGGTSYDTLPRPLISPDGTKVALTSEFLNASPNKNDIFWCVIRYPIPPINISVQKNSNQIRLIWEKPSYTTRGWPDEKTNPPPKSKEIKGYHIWVSDDGSTGWTELTMGAITTEYYDIVQANNSTKYYAITSEEYSRLESRKLSAIYQLTLDASGNFAYSEFAPEGKTWFWTTPPPAPNPATFTIPVGGIYRLKWTEPNNSKIRYYNIYYATDGPPSVDQQHRIASLPVGTMAYIDWLADTTKPGYYKITSVDRQGNEGTIPETNVPVPPQNLRVN